MDIIIIAIIAVLVVFGIRAGVKHFKHESGCCGGSSYTIPAKKLDNVIGQKTLAVNGMTCQHCKNRVEEVINDIDGAAGTVCLKKDIVVVSMSRPIADEVLRAAVEKAGYTVTEIRA